MIEKLKSGISFWGFPIAVILVIVVVLSFLAALGGPPGPGSPYKPRVEAPAAIYEPREYNDVPQQLNLTGLTESNEAAGSGGQASGGYVPTDAPPGQLSPGSRVPGPGATFVFRVYGRAHGVGLCMDGVKYRALAGQSCMSIINYYYTGVTLARIDDARVIRVKGRDGAVRSMSMHDYLCRLAEEPEDYPTEGLKVLYIAARTYTLSCINRGKHASDGYDICSSGSCCQAFDENKDLSRSPNNVAAVNATAGQVLYHNGAPITAAYCGSCGGHTENSEDGFGGAALAYLRGKPDSYCSRSPRFCAVKEFTVDQLGSRLGVAGLSLLDLSDRTPGGRVRNARVVGDGGAKVMTGRALAGALGFSSTRFEYSFR